MSPLTILLVISSLCLFVAGQTPSPTIDVPLVPPSSGAQDDAIWVGAFNPNGTLDPNGIQSFAVSVPSNIAKGKSLSVYVTEINTTYVNTTASIQVDAQTPSTGYDTQQVVTCTPDSFESTYCFYINFLPSLQLCDPAEGTWTITVTNVGEFVAGYQFTIAIDNGGLVSCDVLSLFERIIKYIEIGAIVIGISILLCVGGCVYCCIRKRKLRQGTTNMYTRVPTND